MLLLSEYSYVVVRKILNIVTILLAHFLTEDQTLLEYFTHILSQYKLVFISTILS